MYLQEKIPGSETLDFLKWDFRCKHHKICVVNFAKEFILPLIKIITQVVIYC